MRKLFAVMALSVLAAHVMAAVSPEEAAKLGTTLTPVGAEKAGNADGSIPAWTGGIPKNAGAVDSKGFLADPFANEKPLFVITAATVDKYKDKLSEGQVAMFKRYPETYKIPVYPTHRTVNLPPNIYESIKRSALNVHAINDGNGLENFTGNRYYAFPIPKNGVEVLWNHITRYHGGNLKRIITQARRGSFTWSRVSCTSSTLPARRAGAVTDCLKKLSTLAALAWSISGMACGTATSSSKRIGV